MLMMYLNLVDTPEEKSKFKQLYDKYRNLMFFCAKEILKDDGLAEDAQMQASARITCESRYMNGVWQGAREGAWGGMKLGCREVLGCTGCPADTGDGCGLQKSGSNRYFNMIGSLKPRWEASGKGPNDDPYGI